TMDPIYFLPIIPIGLVFAGIYYTFFAKQDKARQYVQTLFDDSDRNEHMKRVRQQHFVLKKRRQDQNKLVQELDMDLERANLLLKPKEFLIISFGALAVCFIIAMLMGKGPLVALLAGVGGLFIPKIYLKLRIMLRMAKARAQFADVLDTMVSCFKSGYGFSRAI